VIGLSEDGARWRFWLHLGSALSLIDDKLTTLLEVETICRSPLAIMPLAS
jgi:hypothetical protein